MIEATLACIARFGISKTTVDDVARQARVSRATLYRYFPGGRDEIIGAAVWSEIDRFFDDLAAELEASSTIEDRLVVAMTLASDQLASNQALAFVLAQEPEAILPRVAFAAFGDVLSFTGAFMAPYLAAWLEPEDARRVGEWITRLVLSHAACPPGAIDGLSMPGPSRSSFHGGAGTPFALHVEPLGEERARCIVRQFVLPGIDVLMSTRRSAASATVPNP